MFERASAEAWSIFLEWERGELAKQADFLLQPLAAAERKQLIDALTRIADHWETHAAPSAHETRPRSARALQALQQLADGTELVLRPVHRLLAAPEGLECVVEIHEDEGIESHCQPGVDTSTAL